MKEGIDADKDVLTSEKQDRSEDGKDKETYENLDNLDSPSIENDYENNGKKKIMKIKRQVKYPRYHSTSSSDL